MVEAAASTGPDLAELVDDWLTVKRIARRRDDPGHSERARRSDLRRWGEAIAVVNGIESPIVDSQTSPWHFVMTKDFNPESVLRAFDWLGTQGLADATRQRLLANLRGWCRWLAARGHLDHDPTAVDELRLPTVNRVLDGRAFGEHDVARLHEAAAAPAPPRARSRWPTRDVAIVGVLAGCGLRVSELCALTITSVRRDREHPTIQVRRGAKGGSRRDVPIPRSTLMAIDDYLAERATRFGAQPRSADVLFTRTDGKAFTQQTVDKLLRMLSATVGVELPIGAMAHALRHHYGVQLAVRGVPVPVIQQLLATPTPARPASIPALAASTSPTPSTTPGGCKNQPRRDDVTFSALGDLPTLSPRAPTRGAASHARRRSSSRSRATASRSAR